MNTKKRTKKRKILMTSAMLYANGPLHLGHMVEVVQADIWARFQRLCGHDLLYVSGEDAHGTPIMINAEKAKMAPEDFIAKYALEHKADLNDFLISLNNYYTTHASENQELSDDLFHKLKARGDIQKHTIEQAFDEEKNMFLPDRYIRGECPRCHSKEQYGDNCEQCGATYETSELINPISTLSGKTPIQKTTEHYFFELPKYHNLLKKWLDRGHLQPEIANKLREWLKEGLKSWDVSRDTPYFGFKIPGTTDKYYYVWLDAPVGYIAATQNYCDANQRNYLDYWARNSDAELYHFIGKDIISFHGLFWPAMLSGADYRLPDNLFVHGFLTVNGTKMSKSRGTFLTARTYLNHLQPEYLRYYFAAKLSSSVEDIDLNFSDFIARVNADLVGKVINIASRCAGFIHKNFQGKLAPTLSNSQLFYDIAQKGTDIARGFETREYSKAIRTIMECADQINQYIDAEKPWVKAKTPETLNEVQGICTLGLNCFKQLMVYLKPVLPEIAKNSEDFLNIAPLTWDDLNQPLLNHTVNLFKPLLSRIELGQIENMQDHAKVTS